MAKLNLSSPWVQYYHQVEAFFKNDNEVKVVYNEEKNVLNIYVADPAKADALGQIFPYEKTWGNVTLLIKVVPANNQAVFTMTSASISVWAAAFKNNPVVSDIKVIKNLYSNDLTYIIFRKEVVQYFTDSLADYYGQRSTLYQDIAEDIFIEHENVFFCTNKDDVVYCAATIGNLTIKG